MNYLIDSCVIISNLNEASTIMNMKKAIYDNEVAISNIILEELRYPQNAKFEDNKLETLINNMIAQNKIKYIDINQMIKDKYI